MQVTDTVRNSTLQPAQIVITDGDGLDSRHKGIGLVEEGVTIDADVAASGNGPSFLFIWNHDATNFVEFGTSTGVYWGRVDPGEYGWIPLNGTVTTLYFKADTAECQIEYRVHERGS